MILKNGGSYSLFSPIVTQTGQENVLYYMYLKPCDILFELFLDSISKI